MLAHPSAGGAVRDRLLSPERPVNLPGLCEQWFATDITVRIAGASKMVGDPGLPGRIRGAFGAALLESASPEAASGQPCPWSPPCTFEILFRKQGRMEAGFEFPAPWVVLVDPDGRDLLVTLRLFGFAADYAPAASEALLSALGSRLDLAGSTGFFLPKREINSRTIEAESSLDFSSADQEFILDFLAPVVLSSTSPITRPQSLISALAVRAAGLARWHDLRLEIDRDELHSSIDQLDLEWSNARDIHWTRGSNRQQRTIPMGGHVGQLCVSGTGDAIAFVAPLLAIGQSAFIGADVAFGCGRFVLLEN